MKRIISFLLAALLPFAAQAAIDTRAQYAILQDFDTGTVLYAKEPDVQMPPSSMSKLMTVYILYSRLKEGRVKLDDTFPVSEKAWRMQGSKMFVQVGDAVKVEDLLRGIVIQSGNDACIVVAEGLSGTEEAFVQEMNRTAKEIGLTSSHFVNATGWPDEGHLMTVRDLATLATHIIRDFPEYYHYDAEQEFTYNGIRQQNRNRLLGGAIGVDGLKTGHTEIGGYGITLSAKDPKTGRRLILVINGMKTDNERMEEGDKLLRYGFREFENRKILSAYQTVDHAPVWRGKAESVPLVAEQDLVMTLPAGGRDVTYTLSYDGPAPAPIAKGAALAALIVSAPGQEPVKVPLVAGEDVQALSLPGRIWANFLHLLTGK